MALCKVGRWRKKKTSATIFWLLPALHFAQNAHLVSAMAIYDAMNSSQTYYSTILGLFSSISGSLTFSGWETLMLSQYKAKQVTIANSCVLTYSRIILLITEPQPFSNELLYVHVISDFLALMLSNFSPWGLAASYSHRAYGAVFFHDVAVRIWNTVTPLVITEADAASGSHPLKNITFPPSCNGRMSWNSIFTHSFVFFSGPRFGGGGCILGDLIPHGT